MPPDGEPFRTPDGRAVYCWLDAEAGCEEATGRLPLAVAVLEPLVDDDALLVEDEGAGIRDADDHIARRDAVEGVVLLHPLVEQAEPSNGVAALVGQQGVHDAVLLGELRQRVDRVVADRKYGDAVSGVVREALLQLHELALTVRSPACAAVEEDQHPPAAANGVQVDHLTRLVGQRQVRETLANGRADRGEVDRREPRPGMLMRVLLVLVQGTRSCPPPTTERGEQRVERRRGIASSDRCPTV